MDIAATSRTAQPAAVGAESRPRFTGLEHPLPQFLYYATLFTIPFFRWRQFGPVKLDWLLVLALGGIAIPYILCQKSIPRSFRSNLWPWFGLFFIANLASSLLSPYPEAARDGMMTLVLDFLFIAINLIMIERVGFFVHLPLVVAGSITINAFLAVLGYFFQVEQFLYGTRGIGGTIGANNAALMGVYVLPLVAHWIFHASTRPRTLLAIVALIVNILGIISTESRAGFLNMALVLLFLSYKERHRFNPRYLGLLMAGLAMTALATLLVTPEEYVSRIATLAQGTQADVSTQRRSTYVVVAFDSFLKHPILGTGANTFAEIWATSSLSRQFGEAEERAAHNTYLEVIVASGLVGLILFLLLLGRALGNYTAAIHIARETDQPQLESMANAYRIAFGSVLFYFLFKSGLDHKIFLLALPLSQVALDVARNAAGRPAEKSGIKA